jgi:hypothetical protein
LLDVLILSKRNSYVQKDVYIAISTNAGEAA